MEIQFEDIVLGEEYLVTQYDGRKFEAYFDGDFWQEFDPSEYDYYTPHSKESVIKIELL